VIPIVVCADDFGHSSGTSLAILWLLQRRAINATSCMVGGQAWPAMAPALRHAADADPRLAVGLHLNFTERLAQAGEGPRTGSQPAGLAALLAPPRRSNQGLIADSIAGQWDAFVTAFGREPDFVDGHHHAHLAPGVQAALVAFLARIQFAGWVRQCRTSSARPGTKRLALDQLSDQFRQRGERQGLTFNTGFGGLRGFRQDENLEALWRTDLAAMRRGGVLMVHPGDDSASRSGDSIGSHRRREAGLLAQGVIPRILNDLGCRLDRWPAVRQQASTAHCQTRTTSPPG
jgi:hypothetical protein